LVEEAHQKIDKDKAEKLVKKIKKGRSFDLEDFRDQLREIGKMGGLTSIMGKLPGMGALAQAAKDKVNDKSFIQIEAIINSMTPRERRFPDLIKGSRKRRIAMGSGTDVQAVNRLLKQFTVMQKMMKKMSQQGGLMKMMRGIQGKFPGGGALPLQ
jgi:signal recognition particle subunit SRP54